MADAAPPARRRTLLSPELRRGLVAARLPIVIVLALAGFALVEPRVLSLANLQNIAVQGSYLAIFTMAQAMVLITRGLDLSIGSLISLVSVVASMAMASGGDPTLAIAQGVALGLAVALVVGFANGLLVAVVGINPLIATLAMANILIAFASTVSGGFPIPGIPAVFTDLFSQGAVLGVPVPILAAALVFLALGFVLKATVFGRSLYLIGANPKAARPAGLRAKPFLTLNYVLCSGLCGLGALLLTARTGSGEPNLGGNFALEAIAAAVVGGVRLKGGEGGVGAALVGALFITVLSNGMNLVRVDGYLQQILLGLIIIASLVFDQEQSRRA